METPKRLFLCGPNRLSCDNAKLAFCLALMFPPDQESLDYFGVLAWGHWFSALAVAQGSRSLGAAWLPSGMALESIAGYMRVHGDLPKTRAQFCATCDTACDANGIIILPCSTQQHRLLLFVNFGTGCLEIVDSNYETAGIKSEILAAAFRAWVQYRLRQHLQQRTFVAIMTLQVVALKDKYFAPALGPQISAQWLEANNIIKTGTCVAWAACLGYLRSLWPPNMRADHWLQAVAVALTGSAVPPPSVYYAALMRLTIQLLEKATFVFDSSIGMFWETASNMPIAREQTLMVQNALSPSPRSAVTAEAIRSYIHGASLLLACSRRLASPDAETSVERVAAVFGPPPSDCEPCNVIPYLAIVWTDGDQYMTFRWHGAQWRPVTLVVTQATINDFRFVLPQWVRSFTYGAVVLTADKKTLAIGSLDDSDNTVFLEEWGNDTLGGTVSAGSRFRKAVALSALLAAAKSPVTQLSFPQEISEFPTLQLMHDNGTRFVPLTPHVYTRQANVVVATTPRFPVNYEDYELLASCSVQDYTGVVLLDRRHGDTISDLKPGEYAWQSSADMGGHCVVRYDAVRHAYVVVALHGDTQHAFNAFCMCSQPAVLALDWTAVPGLPVAVPAVPDPCGYPGVAVRVDATVTVSAMYVASSTVLLFMNAAGTIVSRNAPADTPVAWRVPNDSTYHVFSPRGVLLGVGVVGDAGTLTMAVRFEKDGSVTRAVIRTAQQYGRLEKLVLTPQQFGTVAADQFFLAEEELTYVWYGQWQLGVVVEVSTPYRFRQFRVRQGKPFTLDDTTSTPVQIPGLLPPVPGVYVRLAAMSAFGEATLLSHINISGTADTISEWAWQHTTDTGQTVLAAAMFAALLQTLARRTVTLATAVKAHVDWTVAAAKHFTAGAIQATWHPALK